MYHELGAESREIFVSKLSSTDFSLVFSLK